MSNIEKIRSEIERLKSKYRHNGLWLSSTQSLLAGAKIEAMNELLPFLDSLQQEQQEEPDKSLEEAADKHIRKVVDVAGHPGWDWTTQDIADAFIAGAKWQKQQMLKDAVEGEAEELYNDGEIQCVVSVGTYFKPSDEVYIIPKED